MLVFKVGTKAWLWVILEFLSSPNLSPQILREGSWACCYCCFLTKVIHLPLPWKGCWRTPCSLSDLEWSRYADPRPQVVLKNPDLFKQVVFECAWSSKLRFKEMSLLCPFLPRLELNFAIMLLRATGFPSSFLRLIWAALNLYGLEVFVRLKPKGQAPGREAP